MSETVGSIKCPTCGAAAPIKKNKRGALFIACRSCGSDPRHSKPLQEYILANGDFERGKKPAAVPEPEKKTTPKKAAPPSNDDDDDDAGDLWNL